MAFMISLPALSGCDGHSWRQSPESASDNHITTIDLFTGRGAAVMGKFDDRVAVITGAGRGIGRETALLMAREGARVVVNDLGGGPQGGGADASFAQQV